MQAVINSAEAAPASMDRRWMPLRIGHGLANTHEDISKNIQSALDRNLPRYMTLVGSEKGTVSVVGSGPSLKRNWHRIPKLGGDIIACNAAYQFLLEKGITPKYMMCFDADPLMLEFMTPHSEVTFLLASRCPPKAFDLIEGCNVVCWHAAGDRDIEHLLQQAGRFDDPMVIGGTSATTRGMLIAQTLGYTDIHMWGADASFEKGETHIRKSTTLERRMFVNMAGRVFETAPWMTQQVKDFEILAPPLRDLYGVKLTVHGDGLLPQAAASMGFSVDWSLAVRQFFRQWKWNAMNLWNTI